MGSMFQRLWRHADPVGLSSYAFCLDFCSTAIRRALWRGLEISKTNHLEERLLDQAQARTSYTPPFWGSFVEHTPRHDI